MPKYVVAYAKIADDPKQHVILQGVYFGGVGDSPDEAQSLARNCVNSVRGGTILPRVIELDGSGKLLDAMYEATEQFEKIVARMVEADEIITRTANRKQAKTRRVSA